MSTLWLCLYLAELLHFCHTYERSTVKVTSFYRVCSVALSLFRQFTSHEIHTTHEFTICHASFPGHKVKGQGHMGHFKFLLCLLCHLAISLHMWNTYNTWRSKCHIPISGWEVEGQGHMSHLKFLPCPLCDFLLIWPNHSICGIRETPEKPMCHAPFSGWNIKGKGHMGCLKFLALSAPWLHLYLT